MPVSMMAPLNVSRSTIAAQRRGSVKVFVHPEKDSLDAIAIEFFSPAFGEDLEEKFRAAPTEFHIAEPVDGEQIHPSVAGLVNGRLLDQTRRRNVGDTVVVAVVVGP